jgi:outer membrane protein assembly factor BamB
VLRGRPAAAAAGVALVLLAAGCGSFRLATPRLSRPSAAPPQAARRPLVDVRVVDGDTGVSLRRATVGIRAATRRGRTLFALRHRVPLVATVSAPFHETRTLRLPFDRYRHVTVRLFRPDGQWTTYGVTPARTQAHAGIALRPPFRIVWGRALGALLEFPAVVDDGVAYLTNYAGELFALSMANGRTLWSYDLRTTGEAASPAVAGDELVVHRKDGGVYVFDRATGRLRWHRPTAGEIESSPVVLRGVDYLGDWAGDVYAFDLAKRRARWVYHDGCKITAGVAISGSTLYVGDYCGRLLALSTRTGALRWSASAGSPVYGTSAVAAGRVFTPSRDAGALYAFTTSGRQLWRVSTGGYVYSAPAVWAGRVYFGSYTGVLYCVSAATGRVLWTRGVGGRISGSPTVIDGVVYAGSFAHRIVGADARTGRVLFTFPHGEYVAVSGNRARLLLYGWSRLWAVEPRR